MRYSQTTYDSAQCFHWTTSKGSRRTTLYINPPYRSIYTRSIIDCLWFYSVSSSHCKHSSHFIKRSFIHLKYHLYPYFHQNTTNIQLIPTFSQMHHLKAFKNWLKNNNRWAWGYVIYWIMYSVMQSDGNIFYFEFKRLSSRYIF